MTLQAVNLCGCQRAGLSAGQIAEADGADSCAYQVFWVQMKMRENAAYFAVFPFNQANSKRFCAELFDALRPVADIVNGKPRTKLADEGGRYRRGRLDAVLFFYAAGRMAQSVCKIAVVGKNDEAGGQKIEPPNIVKPLMYFAGKQVTGKGTVLRVSLGTKKTGRFVQYEVM